MSESYGNSLVYARIRPVYCIYRHHHPYYCYYYHVLNLSLSCDRIYQCNTYLFICALIFVPIFVLILSNYFNVLLQTPKIPWIQMSSDRNPVWIGGKNGRKQVPLLCASIQSAINSFNQFEVPSIMEKRQKKKNGEREGERQWEKTRLKYRQNRLRWVHLKFFRCPLSPKWIYSVLRLVCCVENK